MSTPIVVLPADRAPSRARRGIGLGIASFVLSTFTGFWAIILWAVSIGAAEQTSARAIAIVFFTICAIVGFGFFAMTALLAVFSFRRNLRLGRIWAAVASVIALASLIAGVVVAVTVASA